MQQQEQQQKEQRFLLPPVRLYSRSRTSNNTIRQVLNIAKIKKLELEEVIRGKQKPKGDVQLSYINSWQVNEEKTIVTSFNNPAMEEQMLARGSIDEWAQPSPQKKSRLMEKQLRLSSHRSKYQQRYKTQPKDENKQAPLADRKNTKKRNETISSPLKFTAQMSQSQVLPKYYKKQRFQSSPSPKRSQHVQTMTAQCESEFNYAEEEVQTHDKGVGSRTNNLKDSREEAEVNQFMQKPVFAESRYESIAPQISFSSKPVSKFGSKTKKKPEKEKKRELSVQEYYEPTPLAEPSQNMLQFYEAIYTLQKSSKTNERLERAAISLESINPFFKKVQRVIAVCLLRIGKIINKSPQAMLYQNDMSYTYFYIILSGRIKLTGKNKMQKNCQTGQTLLEEIIFDCPKNGEEPSSYQKAKVIEQAWLLKVQLAELGKLERQLVKYGFKQGLTELKNILKRNQIVKNWTRNKFKLLSRQ